MVTPAASQKVSVIEFSGEAHRGPYWRGALQPEHPVPHLRAAC
jgi:hypothetical protein